MRSVSSSIAFVAVAAACVVTPLTANAQQVQVQIQPQYQPQQPVYQQAPPPPPDAQVQGGLYVAPMQQQTQQTYVPQSVALSGPGVIHTWRDGDPIPPGYHPVDRARTGLIAGGATMFGIPYFFSVIGGAACAGGCNAMFVPVIGPFIEIGSVNSGDAGANGVADVFLVMDGLLQAGGIAMFIVGVAVPKTILLRNDLGAIKHIIPTPIVSRNFTGAGLSAQF